MTALNKPSSHEEDLRLLCLYNKPNVDPLQNPNRANYERSLVEADRILAELEPAPAPQPAPTPTPEVPMPSFNFGFKDIADALGPDVVGSPITDEQPFNPAELTVQYTNRGVMLYHKPSNTPLFFEAQRP